MVLQPSHLRSTTLTARVVELDRLLGKGAAAALLMELVLPTMSSSKVVQLVVALTMI